MRALFACCGLLLTAWLGAQLFPAGVPLAYLDLHQPEAELALDGAQAAFLLELDSGSVLYRRSEHLSLSSASVAKVATLFWVMQKAEREGLGRESPIGIRPAGDARERFPGAVLFGLRKGDQWPLGQLMAATAALSTADTSYALADYFGPGVERFRQQLNAIASLLRLTGSSFADVDGWSKETRMSAEDVARLVDVYLRWFPHALADFHAVRRVEVADGTERRNTNTLLGRYPQADGVKTGFTYEAGFNMVASAKRNGRRLVAVVMGIHAPSIAQGLEARARASARLLDYGFEQFASFSLNTLPEVWLVDEDGSQRWQISVTQRTTLTRFLPSLRQQRYHLRLDRVKEGEAHGFLFLKDEEGRFLQNIAVVLRPIGRRQRPGRWAALEHRGPLLALLRATPIRLKAD